MQITQEFMNNKEAKIMASGNVFPSFILTTVIYFPLFITICCNVLLASVLQYVCKASRSLSETSLLPLL